MKLTRTTALLALRFFLSSAPTHGWLAPTAVLETSSSRKRAAVALLSASSSSSQEGEGEEDPRKEFVESINSFQFDQQEPLSARKSGGVEGDPLMGYRPEELEAYAEMLTPSQQQQQQQQPPNNNSVKKFKEDVKQESDDDDDDALLLDPDLYIKSRDRLNPDGSIRQSSNDNDSPKDSDDPLADATIDEKYRDVLQKYIETIVEAPDSAYDEEKDDKTPPAASDTRTTLTGNDASMDDLWKFLGERGLPTFDPAAAEALHQQVFREEQGHLQQSETFQASLLDSSAADQAATERRGREFRERQEAAEKELDEQIREFEATTLPKLQRSGDDDDDAAAGVAKPMVDTSQRRPQPPLTMRPPSRPNKIINSSTSWDNTVGIPKQAQKDPTQQLQPPPPSMMRPPSPPNNIIDSSTSRNNTAGIPKQAQKDPTQQRRPPPSLRMRPPSRPNNIIDSSTSRNNTAGIPKQAQKDPTQQHRPVPSASSLPPRPSIPRAAAIKPSTMQRPPVARSPFRQRTRYIATTTQAPMGGSQQPQVSAKENVLPNHAWQEVEDPDTKELFYWNEETGEMRWELDSD